MSEQKIFNFQINQSFEYDDFCISKCNELAHNNIINKKNIERLIYLKGPAKSGKTHLGKIWKKINHAYLFSYKNYEKFITKNKNIFIDNLTENLDEEKIHAIPEKDLDRTSEEGKASSVQFVHFNFSLEQIKKFKNPNSKIILSVDHSLYRHATEITEETKNSLTKDFI